MVHRSLHGRLASYRPNGWFFAGIAAFAALVLLTVNVLQGSDIPRPAQPGGGLPRQLAALRGANDLIRGSAANVGESPSLYTTAYGRLESSMGSKAPAINSHALVSLVRQDAIDTPAWRAYYLCRAAESDARIRAGDVLASAGVRVQAERESLRPLRTPQTSVSLATSVAERAAFLHVLSCLGSANRVPRADLARLAEETGRLTEPVAVLAGTEALRSAGVSVSPGEALRKSAHSIREGAQCPDLDSMNEASRVLLGLYPSSVPASTVQCLTAGVRSADSQTRWLSRRALHSMRTEAPTVPAPAVAFTREGLVNKVPVQMGTLRATYQAARALTASGQPEKAPQWLTDELVRLGSDPELDAADEIPLAMVCHRLQLDCGSRADKGTQRIGRLRVPEQLVPGNERLWQDAMTARAEFQMGCPRTQVRRENLPYGTSSPQFLMILRTLGESDCTTQVQELARGIDLVALARDTLKKGEIVQGSDALQAAIAAGRVIPQRMWQEMPDLVNNNRAPEGRDLFSKFAGGPASSQATAAGYYLLA